MQHSDREFTYHRLKELIQQYCAESDDASELIPPDFSLLFDGHLHGWEAVVLSTLITSALWRGADADACTRYTVSGDAPLPFEGCERRLFDVLLASIRDRTDDADVPVRMVRALADLQARLIVLLKRNRNGRDTHSTTTGPGYSDIRAN